MPCIPSARDMTSLCPMGIATIDTHRILKKKGKISSSYILKRDTKMDTQGRSLSRVLNVNQTSEHNIIHLVTRGVVKSTQLQPSNLDDKHC